MDQGDIEVGTVGHFTFYMKLDSSDEEGNPRCTLLVDKAFRELENGWQVLRSRIIELPRPGSNLTTISAPPTSQRATDLFGFFGFQVDDASLIEYFRIVNGYMKHSLDECTAALEVEYISDIEAYFDNGDDG